MSVDVIVVGGANIDHYQNPKNLDSFSNKLGGDAANTAVRLTTAKENDWLVGEVTLAALVGSTADPYGVTGQFIVDALAEAGVRHDTALNHSDPVRYAMWFVEPGKKHKIDQTVSYLKEPTYLISECEPYKVHGNSQIILLASMATTLGWDHFENYLDAILRSSFFSSVDALIISSTNGREISDNELYSDGKNLPINKRKHYDDNLALQIPLSDIVVESMDGLPLVFPQLADLSGDDLVLQGVATFRELATNDDLPIIISRGKKGLEIYPGKSRKTIKIPAIEIGNAQIAVGSGGAALTGLILVLAQAGISKSSQIFGTTDAQWTDIGKAMVIFSAYHLDKENGLDPEFPKPTLHDRSLSKPKVEPA